MMLVLTVTYFFSRKDQRKMNKGELVATIAEVAGMTKVRAEIALNKVLANLSGAMEKGERVTLSGFGSFTVVERAEQKGRNPQTGQAIVIPAHNVVKFKPGKNLVSRVK
jgi:DNA-binding protein HU-beta